MNERIKELCKQVGGISYDDDNEVMTPTLVGKQVEKFAELIIKECVSLMESEKEYYSNDDTTYAPREYYERMSAKEDAFNDAASMIKTHFEV